MQAPGRQGSGISRFALLRLDPDLGTALEPSERAAAERLLVPVSEAPVGPWRPPDLAAAGAGALGFLVLDGLLTRRVVIADTRCTELIGRSDVIRPWSTDAAGLASVPVEADWHVVDRPAKLAVLDRNVSRHLGRWPQITCELFDRTVRRAHWLTFQLAVCRVKGTETRLLMTLWHFADRWGKVLSDGVLVDLHLSHGTLGEIVGAQRPTVTTALGKLRTAEKLRATDDGRWLLLGQQPALQA